MLLTGLALGIALGFTMQRGRFCVTGGFRDLWIARKTRWLTAFLIVIAVQSVGVFALDALGVIKLVPKDFPWLAVIIGAFIFGFAIVLAGGCATGTIFRAGEGLVGSWFALVFYAIFATITKVGPLAPLTHALRGVSTETSTIHGMLGISPWILVGTFLLIVGLLVRYHLLEGAKLPTLATLPPRKTGLAHLFFEKPWGAFTSALIIAVIAIAAWPLSWVTGRKAGLGITTPFANIGTYLSGGDAAVVDWGVYLVIGILVGATIAAKGSGEFRIRMPDAVTTVRAIIGGSLMGIGAVLAGGCTIGNALVNTATFGLVGWTSLIFMILGTGVATRIFIIGSAKGHTTPAAAPTYASANR